MDMEEIIGHIHVEGALRNVEKEIVRECMNEGIEAHEDFISYYIKLLALDPSWGLNSKTVSRTDVHTFIAFVVDKLKDQYTPSMIALKMQLYFDCNFHMKQKMLKRNRSELLFTLRHLEQEILDIKSFSEEENDIQLMYKRMVYFMTLASGLGNPCVEPIYNEVRAALGSILDKNEMIEFAKQLKADKLESLEELTKLVTGIRLFNKDCGKGGEGMEDLPKLIESALVGTSMALRKILVNIMDKVNLMTTGLDLAYYIDIDDRLRYVTVCSLPNKATEADIEYVKDCLIVYRQYELHIRKLIDEVDRIEARCTTIHISLQRALIQLHQVVKHRIAIPVNQVFPHFIKLSNIWCSLQDQTVLLAKMNQIMNDLQKYIKILSFDESIAEMLIPPDETVMTDAERMENAWGRISPFNSSVEVKNRSIFNDINNMKLEYLGFCGWKLSTTGGALIPGNANLGIVRAMNMNFVFSSVTSGEAFSKFPEKNIMEAIQIARRKPELITLLDLKDQMVLLQNIKDLVIEPPVRPLTEEIEVQTETHPIETFIDRNYSWNVWDLRRKAIKTANVSHGQTASCQTIRTFHRFNFKGQTCEMKDQCVQTMKDNYSNVPKPATFIFGLRGRKDDKQFIIDLTRPVNE